MNGNDEPLDAADAADQEAQDGSDALEAAREYELNRLRWRLQETKRLEALSDLLSRAAFISKTPDDDDDDRFSGRGYPPDVAASAAEIVGLVRTEVGRILSQPWPKHEDCLP